MRILITGGAGFIGQHLVRRLSKHHHVRVLDSLIPQVHGTSAQIPAGLGEVEFMLGDVRHRADAEAAVADMDVVVHLAAQTGVGQSMYELYSYVDTNELGTASLLQALVDSGHRPRKLVLASSRAIYGEGLYLCRKCGEVTPHGRSAADLAVAQWDPCCPSCGGPIAAIPTHEAAQARPQSVYASAKLSQEHLCRIVGHAYGIAVVILRYFNVYGPGQSLGNPYTGILSAFYSRLSSGDNIEVFEDGLESRDFIYIDDVVDATTRAIMGPSETLQAGVYNVGSGVRVTLDELAGKVVHVWGVAATIRHSGGYRVGDVRHVFADTNRAAQELGFRAAVPMDEGLSRWMHWARQQDQQGAIDVAQQQLVQHNLYRRAGGRG